MRRAPRVVGALLVLLATLASRGPASATVGDAPAFTQTRTISRVHLANGVDEVAEQRAFTLSVSATSNLRGHQEIGVSWQGAHPTGGIITDPNSGDAKIEEYPVVLLQCRGVDSDAVAAAQRLDPTSCWAATSGERFQDTYQSSFPPFRIDRYAPPEERRAIVGAPDPRPAACFQAFAERWVPFRAADGTVYAGGSNGCGGMAPEASQVGGLALPSNTTYGVTHADGTGAAKFDIWTAEDNTSLGCSALVPCALVAVPILGISCDAAAQGLPLEDQPPPGEDAALADATCRATGRFAPGQNLGDSSNLQPDVAVSGMLWWSASNWRNRITVPLTFAPSSNVCEVTGGRAGIDIYGSELMTQAMLQWAPRFCLDPALFRIKHVQTSEPAARNLLSNGGVEAVFSSGVPSEGFSKPVVNAPVALTGFAVTFAIDDDDGEGLTSLRLNARLLAKLLTASYPALIQVRNEYGALAGNPMNISLDPEFVALNPDAPRDVPASASASTIIALSSDADVMAALTDYLDHDPDARAWLDGAPDPYGMVVNPNYRGVDLPTVSWPQLDSFQPTAYYQSDSGNPCLRDNPVPFLPLIAAPMARLASIAQAMQFAIAPSTIVCKQITDTSAGQKLIPLGRQGPGHRFLLGVTSIADSLRYGLVSASLQTQPGTFVPPDDAGLRALGALLTPDETTQSWPIPYDAIRTPAGAAAYPGGMVVYAQAPTTGLTTVAAADIAKVLRFAGTDGQLPGSATGQLAAGYLPLTAANGLDSLAAYSVRAADAVEAQTGEVPSLIPPPPVESTTTTSTTEAPAIVDDDGEETFFEPSDESFVPDGSDDLTPTDEDLSSGANNSFEPETVVEEPPAAEPDTTVAETAAPAPEAAPEPDGVLATTIAATTSLIGVALPALLAAAVIGGCAALLTYVLGRRKVVP